MNKCCLDFNCPRSLISVPLISNTRLGRCRANISIDVCKYSRRYSIGVCGAVFDGKLRRFK